MTTIQHAPSVIRCGPTVARADTPANYRRGGDIRTLLSPASVGATAGFMGTLTLAPGEILFAPIGWWHQVRAIDFSVTLTYTNFRWRNDFHLDYPRAP